MCQSWHHLSVVYSLAWAHSVTHSRWSTELYWVNWDQPLAAWNLDDFPGIPGHAVQDTVRLAKLPITGASCQHSLPYVRRKFWRMIQRHLLPSDPTAAEVGLNLPPTWCRDYALVYAQMNTWVTSSSVPNNDKHLGNYKMNITCLANLPTLMTKLADHHFYCLLLQAHSKTSHWFIIFIFHSFFYTPNYLSFPVYLCMFWIYIYRHAAPEVSAGVMCVFILFFLSSFLPLLLLFMSRPLA